MIHRPLSLPTGLRYLVVTLWLLLFAAPALGNEAKLLVHTAALEAFRVESTEKLNELYTLRGVYIDSANLAATEGVQIFIGELRTNVILINNVLDIVFLYGLHKEYDDKRVVGEFVVSRLREIQDNLRFNLGHINDLAAILREQKQLTLSDDFLAYRARLVTVADTLRAMIELYGAALGVPQPDAASGKGREAASP